jgi:O-antigen ligase
MQSINTYPTCALAATPAPSGIIAQLRALTLIVWFGSLIINFWWRQEWDWYVDFYEQGFNLRNHYIVGFATVFLAHFTLGIPAWINAPFRAISTTSGKLFTLFCLLALATSPFAPSVRTSGMYSVFTWLVFLLCHLYWSSDFFVVRRAVVVSGVMLFGWLAALLLHHGLPLGFGAGIGGINRNTIAALGIAGMVCCMLSANRNIRWGGIGCCALFLLMVNSRGSILALGVFLAVYYTLHKGTMKAVWHAVLAFVLVAAALLVSSYLKQLVFEDVMRLNDPTRGVGSGFTGRLENWQKGIETFWQRPLFGHGFRAQRGEEAAGLGAHSGYVTLLIETGAFGTFLAMAAVVAEAIRRIKLARQLRGAPPAGWQTIDREQSLRLNTVACGMMAVMLTYWVYEPVYLNLGTVISVVFFLMFAAPDFVAKRPASMRA